MPRLFGAEYSQRDLDRRSERPDQIAGIRSSILNDGRARGVRAFDIRSGAGMRLTSIADRALDVSDLEFRGIPLVWQGPGNAAAPQYYEVTDDSFARNFFGGLFTTCGLGNFGPGGSDEYGTFGIHGLIDHLPAEQLATRTMWEDDACIFEISGKVYERRMFGEQLVLDRKLRVEMGTNRLIVRDVVTNQGGVRTPHMLLYHCNVGFPLLDETSFLELSQRSTRARDAQAQRGIAQWNRGGAPEPSFAEQVFIHEPRACADGFARAIAVNRSLDDGRGVALVIRFDPKQLPAIFTWRMLGVKTYVMGIEPANCPTIQGRCEAAQRGTLPFLDPGESRAYEIGFEVLGGADDIEGALEALA